MEARAFTGHAMDLNMPAMRFSNDARKVQPQTSARNTGFAGCRGAITAVKNVALLLRGNTTSGIADGNHGHVIHYGEGNVNLSAGMVEFDRIIQQVEQEPPDLPGVKGPDH